MLHSTHIVLSGREQRWLFYLVDNADHALSSNLVAPSTFFLQSYGKFAEYYQVLGASQR